MQYMGSKNRIANEIVPYNQRFINENGIETYIEPFCGGANIIDKVNCKRKIGCDINEYLIALLIKARDNPEELPNTITEEEYQECKNNKDKYPKWYVGLVGFCASFGSKWFGGYARNHIGDNSGERCATAINNIKKQSRHLKGIEFNNISYEKLGEHYALKNCVIYCDPPYRGTAKYECGEFDYKKFDEWCIELSKDNIVLISEYDMPRDKFECIWETQHSVNFDSNRETSKVRVERLFIVKGGYKNDNYIKQMSMFDMME